MPLWSNLLLFLRMWNSRARRRGLIWSLPMPDLLGQAEPWQVIYVDILPPVSAESLTPKSHFPALLILVDAFSRFTRIIGMPNKSSQSVIEALTAFLQLNTDWSEDLPFGILKRSRVMQVLNLPHRIWAILCKKESCSFLCSPKASGGESFCSEDLAIPKEACSMHVGPF